MSMDSEIRSTLRRVAEDADAPVIDQAGFDGRVRRHRNRRRARIGCAAAAVTAVALAVPLTVSQIASDPGSASGSFASVGPQVRPPVYFVLAGRAVMLDSTGKLHHLDVRAEAVVGPTEQGVLIASGESRLVHVRVSKTGRAWTFDRVEVPTKQPIQSAAVSADGSRVAVVDLQEDLMIYDLASGDVVRRVPNDRSAYVADFGDQVLYAVGNDSLRLGEGADAIDIPVSHGAARQSATGGNVVAVGDDGSTTRLYDVSGGDPTEIGEVPGMRDSSPDGRYYLSAPAAAPPTLWEETPATCSR